MKRKMVFCRIIAVAAILIFTVDISFSQTQMDTVKTGKSNDPMVVNPGETVDKMAVKPGKTNDDMATNTDTGFISKNIMDNLMEIKLAKLGQSKGTSLQVKKAAVLMISDHTIILNDLKKLAAKKGILPGSFMHDMPLPINKTAGNDFDKTWASQMLTMHENKIAELENYISVSSDPDIKAAASKALPKIKIHRDVLQKLSGAKLKTRVA